jgi:hypothetical protein
MTGPQPHENKPLPPIVRHRPSDELIDMKFKMPADFVYRFKRAALDRDLKCNELLKALFEAAA